MPAFWFVLDGWLKENDAEVDCIPPPLKINFYDSAINGPHTRHNFMMVQLNI